MTIVPQDCRVAACGRPVKRRDLCSPHYKRFLRGLSVDDYTPQVRTKGLKCSVNGCWHDHHAKGYCNAHYLRLLTGADMDAPLLNDHSKMCPEVGCDRPIRTKGLCRGHYSRKVSGSKMTGPIKDVTTVVGCYFEGCERPHCSKGLCSTHSTIRRRYTLTEGQMKTLAKSVCYICQKPETNGKGLSVDHDHSCCPGAKSCGECVRGVLCAACNKSLGLFQDDVKVLARAIKYLNNPGGIPEAQGMLE